MFNKIILSLLIITSIGTAQNLQLHYEASGDREYVVSTLEMFKPDQYGSTFWFVDMEYDTSGAGGVSLTYWEIARAFTLPINNLSATLQYNAGVANFGSFGQAWMVGLNYYLDMGFVALPIDILYRAAQGAKSPDFQLTTTWFIPLLDGKADFSGFLDIWSEDDSDVEGKKIIYQAEPQLWYNINKTFSIGSEVEISYNFAFDKNGVQKDGVQALPTLGLRWNF